MMCARQCTEEAVVKVVAHVKATGQYWGTSDPMCLNHAEAYMTQLEGSVVEVTDIRWLD